MDMNLSKLWEMVKDKGACCATVYMVEKSQICLVTEHNSFHPEFNTVLMYFLVMLHFPLLGTCISLLGSPQQSTTDWVA